ncbi:DUF6083 domain-containing protein [Streptomyces sp. NBC_01142]|uniref:DUF6083 domain-containing protein n=1 Tax=Streptomyces sp. NBC_01142 TaxID=2975865 RepID=UPI0022572E68|nr:DUF6083 domain-containing protein [Streptomyces sp. NBC_01142]MCX4826831.1 DUF6083 domain-containing protein [Streptomyces sp. NBC_01142]
MCSLTTPSGHRWDGTPTTPRRLRSLRVAADSPSRLLRTAQAQRCRDCGNRIDWYTRSHGRPVGLHPQELDAAAVPVSCRWHVDSGIAHAAGDGTRWCRIPHSVLCPAREPTELLTPQLAELRRRLAVGTRRLLDSGALTPPSPSDPPAAEVPVCRPARPVLQILYGRYLAARPVDDIQCVAQTRLRHRCPHRILAPDAPAGVWRLMPATAARGQLALSAADMAVYDLTHVPYAEQLRWRTQRCPSHAGTSAAPDLTLADWEVFDPLFHHQHIHARLPATAQGRRERP